MSKAYNRVEWDYLESILKVHGFPSRCINLIMLSVKIPSLFVLINGRPKGSIVPNKGLRQGIPLSLYLFLLCIKGFVNVLNRFMLDRSLLGIRVCRRAPRLLTICFLRTTSLSFIKQTLSLPTLS